MSTPSQPRLGIRIGQAVREARNRRKMKLTDLAREVGRTAAQISTLERGIYQWTDSVLEACARALEIPLAALLAEDDELVLKLPADADARDQARLLAERLQTASADELRGMLVWSELYRDRGAVEPTRPPAAARGPTVRGTAGSNGGPTRAANGARVDALVSPTS